MATSIATIIARITKSAGRKSVYHFTRAKNLTSIAHFDSLWSSYRILPHSEGERRLTTNEAYHGGFEITVNPNLRIPANLMKRDCTVEQFRSYLDRHVFFWPTRQDCFKMLTTYQRREPSEHFAVLELEASPLLLAHWKSVRLSKYDSGSSPRFPKNCKYRKSLEMFLPLADFGRKNDYSIPVMPSEIKEILIENQACFISRFLKGVYSDNPEEVPINWLGLSKSLPVLFE
ncbi:hypothetical protein MJA45_06425 [Paenibacillus aurantius]|uniref:Uncharacterized protein n=1 Tax=Paenibacillus aurantius TaxID=2918900 RepID=A0AA96LJJ9_9BACL|nr:hypothetical protein [Paenibacillus aurantius]WNQ12662.1 hypothetical protein MJA45_06425 [Paenibacillus aurantius]